MRKIILASNNNEKIQEVKALLLEFEVLSLKDIGFKDEIEENGKTFEENALIKARTVYNALKEKCYVIGDDCGLCVNALNGEPGIYSARYAGDHDFAKNRAKILEKLKGKSDRSAYYYAVIALISPSGEEMLFNGKIEGRILEKEEGEGLYDKFFYSNDLQKCLGVATVEEKKSISHRSKALEKIKEIINKQDTKVVAFDFDDTLYSGADWAPWEEFCKVGFRAMFSELSDEEYNKRFPVTESYTDATIVGRLKEEGVSVKKWLKYRDKTPCDIDYSVCKHTDNGTLKAFADKYTLYIVSNSTKKEIKGLCKYFGIDTKYFRKIIANRFDKETPSKGYIFEKIIKKEKIQPSELFVIGDSYDKDVLPALELGARGKVVEEADFKLEDFDELV